MIVVVIVKRKRFRKVMFLFARILLFRLRNVDFFLEWSRSEFRIVVIVGGQFGSNLLFDFLIEVANSIFDSCRKKVVGKAYKVFDSPFQMNCARTVFGIGGGRGVVGGGRGAILGVIVAVSLAVACLGGIYKVKGFE
ncbi:hypothetical protein B0T20DRAFT_396775 [Sordaria brevicollis]|uniref:Uncharacterized protein n=1 Tax=Sordaria brevicollis TaxID=83679 RepID=A0AAE0U695_SORBR|nr:hypothetical protein B0T20DRAFT_396775 [Sordaria brevicollis]